MDINDDDEIDIDPQIKPNGSVIKPKIIRQKSVSIINSLQDFMDILAQNSESANTQIFQNLQMYVLFSLFFVCLISIHKTP